MERPDDYEVEMLPKDLPSEIPAHASSPAEESQSSAYSLNEVKTLLAWSAPGRPFKKRPKQFYLTAILIAFLIEIILFLFSQYLLMIVVIAVLFLSFAFSYFPPKKFHYSISTEGVRVEDHFYLWQELYDFFFQKKEGVDVLHIRTEAIIPGILTLTLGDVSRDQIKTAMLPFLPYREYIKPTFLERAGEWLSKNFPLEKPYAQG